MWFKRSIIALLLTSCAGAMGGVIITNDGRRLEGELKRANDGWDVVTKDGQTVRVKSSEVKAIELNNNPAGGSQMERLGSLRRSVEVIEDIPKIIDRYRRFIEQTKDKAVIDEALADLGVWQDRLNRGLVKVGKKWITREEQKQLAIDIIHRVDDTRALIKTGRMKEAQQTLEQILADDPENLSAIYLQGVLLQKQDKPADARKAFEAVKAVIPDHAPTLHNLAVILLRQRQWGPACTLMDQALTVAPNVQTLIDAAAELLEALPDEQEKKMPAAQKLAKRFAEQDVVLQKAMADRQMYRWGSGWVDKPTQEKLVEAEKAVKKRLEELQGDFDLTQNRIDRLDGEVKQNEQTLREIESRSFIRTADGSYVRVPYPPAYYDIQRDINRLKGERQEMVKRLDSLRDAAKRAKADYPVPKFSGVVQPIGEDGVPIVVPEGVSLEGTRPAPATNPKDAPPPTPTPPPVIRIGPAKDAM